MIRSCVKHTASILQNLFFGHAFDLAYVVEAKDWSIKQDGLAIVHALNTQRLLRARLTYSPIGLRNQIIHFGSINTFVKKNTWHKPHPSNTVIVTWFHVVPNDPKLTWIREAQKDVHRIHTSCESTKTTLIEAGVNQDKIVVIPLGVDLERFAPVTDAQRTAVREQLGISHDRLVIGSFQKDGVGWSEGFEPKLIKGPDLFVETVARLKQSNPLVLLTGPARGYVKRKLEKHGIEYKHQYLKNFHELPEMYHALDLYLITSRVEGGPKAILESWASGIPVVSTHVGMVPDIGVHEKTVLMSDMNAEALAKQAMRVITDRTFGTELAQQANVVAGRYDWQRIVQEYQERLYKNL